MELYFHGAISFKRDAGVELEALHLRGDLHHLAADLPRTSRTETYSLQDIGDATKAFSQPLEYTVYYLLDR